MTRQRETERGARRASFLLALGLALGACSESGAREASSTKEAVMTSTQSRSPSSYRWPGGFALEDVFIRIDPDADWYTEDRTQPAALQGVYPLRCWMSVGEPVVLSASDTMAGVPKGGELSPVFETLGKMLEAYRNTDLDAFAQLYAASSRARVQEAFSSPEAKQQWSDYVRTIRALKPTCMWMTPVGLTVFAEVDYEEGAAARIPLKALFDENFDLVAGGPSEPMNVNLYRYLEDDSRSVVDLLVNLRFAERMVQ